MDCDRRSSSIGVATGQIDCFAVDWTDHTDCENRTDWKIRLIVMASGLVMRRFALNQQRQPAQNELTVPLGYMSCSRGTVGFLDPLKSQLLVISSGVSNSKFIKVQMVWAGRWSARNKSELEQGAQQSVNFNNCNHIKYKPKCLNWWSPTRCSWVSWLLMLVLGHIPQWFRSFAINVVLLRDLETVKGFVVIIALLNVFNLCERIGFGLIVWLPYCCWLNCWGWNWLYELAPGAPGPMPNGRFGPVCGAPIGVWPW